MTTPSLLALTSPIEVPEAAIARLAATAELLDYESTTEIAASYGPWLAKASLMSALASDLLSDAVDGTISESNAAGLVNVERISRAMTALFGELSLRTEYRAKIAAMYWAKLHRRINADTALTHREYAKNATANIDATLSTAPVRILPGAEPAVSELSRDWLVFGSTWNLSSLTADMLQWVQVSS